jgi:calcineurin-like phosphoesterase family protein
MANWYSADLHLGQRRIIRFCNRPFADTDDMDAALITAFQECVRPDDDLWFLGDFSFGKNDNAEQLARWFKAIPGNKHLVIGNHDTDLVQALPWTSTHDLVSITDQGQSLALCHFPMLAFPGSGRAALQLFGHVHDLWPGSRNSVNVGVDQWNYRPVQLDDLLRRAATLPVNAHLNDVEFGGIEATEMPRPRA